MAFSHGPFTFDDAGSGDVDEFLYTDPLATDATLPQAANTARRWCWTDIDTVSSGVGPEFGVGGDPDGYLYNEMSSPGAFNDEFYLEFDTTLDASSNDIVVNFRTCQRGNNCDATCVVETNENGAGWVERGTTFGGSGDPDKVGTNVAQIWSVRSVDLTGLISHASTRIRIKIVAASAGTSWHNDYGLDEIEFVGTDQVDIEQRAYRFREDDGDEDGATWIAAEDTNITRGKNVNTRLRIQTDVTGSASAETTDDAQKKPTLQYRKVGDPDTEWRDVPEAGA